MPSDAIHLLDVNCRPPLKTTPGRDHLEYLQQMLASARQTVLERMSRAHRVQAATYNATHRDVVFEDGAAVLVYKPIRQVGKADKLQHRWVGPYSVIRRTTAVNYEVTRSDVPGKSDIVHVVRMKPFHTRPPELTAAAVAAPVEPATGPMEKRRRGRPPRVGVPRAEGLTTAATTDPTATAAPQRRSERLRGGPARTVGAVLAAVILGMLLVVLPHQTDARLGEITARHNTWFVEGPMTAFTESHWTIVTDMDLTAAEAVVRQVESWLNNLAKMSDNWTRPGREDCRQFHASIHQVTQDRLKENVRRLSSVAARLQSWTGRTPNDDHRQRRGIIDGGGQALKWLFGVATQGEMEELH